MEKTMETQRLFGVQSSSANLAMTIGIHSFIREITTSKSCLTAVAEALQSLS